MNDFFRKKRTIFFFCFCGLLIVLLLVTYGKLATQPVTPSAKRILPVERGSIVDRYGSPLAVQVDFYHIGVTLKNLDAKDKPEFAANIALPLSLSEEEVMSLLNTSKKFVYLKKKVNQNVYEEVKAITEKFNYNYVSFEKVPGRYYPNKELASQLIGFMGTDGQGLAGIEFSQQDILQPSIENIPENAEEMPQGKNIYLTIDANLQYKLEEVANQTMKSTQAESMMLIAADCKSGEILSYVTLPSADLNDYGSAPTNCKIDRPAMTAYEPGSVFKIFTVGIVYDEGKITDTDSFLCDGLYEHRNPGQEAVRIKCLEHHGWCTPRDALRFSCNDVLGQISDRIDEDLFMARIRQLGFGSRTGVEVPGETTGSVKDTSSKLWSARSKPTIAIGQEISVSALQMIQATTAIANGGVPVKLTMLQKITNRDGSTYYEHQPETKERVFSKKTADYILSCMETTARSGTGTRANLGDISIGVKTGTAQMADKEHGGYSQTDFLSNCIAIFPIEDPQIVLYIVVEKAKGENYAGRIVAPVIAESADIIIDHLGMGRGGAASLEHNGVITIPQTKPIQINGLVPDFTGKSKKELFNLMQHSEIKLNINGNGWVTSQNPEAGTPITEDTVIELNLE